MERLWLLVFSLGQLQEPEHIISFGWLIHVSAIIHVNSTLEHLIQSTYSPAFWSGYKRDSVNTESKIRSNRVIIE